MEYNRIYNFSSGPAVMPVSVLEQIRDELLNYGHTGMSVMEMSHRSQSFLDIKDQAIADLRKLMNIPDQYKVMFIQGGATLQFAMIPWNLMRNGKATYIETAHGLRKPLPKRKSMVRSPSAHPRLGADMPVFQIAQIWILHRTQTMYISVKMRQSMV